MCHYACAPFSGAMGFDQLPGAYGHLLWGNWGLCACKCPRVLRSGGLKVRLAQGNCVGEFKGKGSGRVFGNDQR